MDIVTLDKEMDNVYDVFRYKKDAFKGKNIYLTHNVVLKLLDFARRIHAKFITEKQGVPLKENTIFSFRFSDLDGNFESNYIKTAHDYDTETPIKVLAYSLDGNSYKCTEQAKEVIVCSSLEEVKKYEKFFNGLNGKGRSL